MASPVRFNGNMQQSWRIHFMGYLYGIKSSVIFGEFLYSVQYGGSSRQQESKP